MTRFFIIIFLIAPFSCNGQTAPLSPTEHKELREIFSVESRMGYLRSCPKDKNESSWSDCWGIVESTFRYLGEFKEGVASGWGTGVYQDGTLYVGKWGAGMANGEGILFDQTRRIRMTGRWVDGRLDRSYIVSATGWPFGSVEAKRGQLTNNQYSKPGDVGKICDFDLFVDDYLIGRLKAGEVSSRFEGLPMGPRTFRLELSKDASFLCRKIPLALDSVILPGKTIEYTVNMSLISAQLADQLKTRTIENDGTAIDSILGSHFLLKTDVGLQPSDLVQEATRASIAQAAKDQANRVSSSTTDQPGNLPTQTSISNQSKIDQDLLAAEVEAERKKRQGLEERLAAELKERERLAQEAKDREKQLAEVKEREQRSPSPPTQVASPKNPHALIIGNAAYPGSSRLDNPINDAKAIEQKLKSMGFTVTVVTDANRQRLVQAMSQFRKTASNADLSLLFYSGHGVQIFGTNYILPIDVDQSDVAQATIQGVSLNSVVESFLPGKTKIVFLDACRDNPLQRSNDRSVSKGLAPISVAQGTLIAYATKDGQTASDGVGQKNSPFTKALLEHLSDPQDIAVILRKVREKVMTATGGKQQPWEYGSLTGGELVLGGVKR